MQSSLSASRQSESIKVKINELRAKLEEVKREKSKIEDEMMELQSKGGAGAAGAAQGEDYSWQQGEPVKGFNMLQVIVVALLALALGRFLATTQSQ